jgi:hypothetical protein
MLTMEIPCPPLHELLEKVMFVPFCLYNQLVDKNAECLGHAKSGNFTYVDSKTIICNSKSIFNFSFSRAITGKKLTLVLDGAT